MLTCTPQAGRHTHATQLSQDLLKENSDARRRVESEWQVVLSPCPDGEGGVYVQGAEEDVYATVRELNDMLERGQSSSLLTPHRLNQYGSPCRTSPRSEPSLPSRPIPETSNVDQILTNLPEHVKLALSKEAISSRSLYLARGVDTHHEQRVKSFVDLGFVKEKVEFVIHTLPEAHDDDILARLISSHQGREAVDEVKMDVMGPDRCRIQIGKTCRGTVSCKPSPKPPDQLRHIVIDGSNVAMR